MTPAQRKAAATALAVAIAGPAEGLRQWAYRDPAQGVPTICFGHTRGVQMGDYATVAQCDALLTTEMKQATYTVEACRPGLPVNVLAAFSDAVYNLGPTVACDDKDSAAARLLRAGNYVPACNELPKWNEAKVRGIKIPLPGLTNRRATEQKVCLS